MTGGPTNGLMARIGTVPAMVFLVAVSWAIPLVEYLVTGMASVISLATAAMFTLMLAILPRLSGRRLHRGHAERALMCRDCHALRWPNDLSFGFCIHCGSARPAVRAVLA